MRLNIRFLDNISFTWKLMLSYIVLLLIPLSISGVYVYMRLVQPIQEQTKIVYRDMLRQKKNDIENKISDYEKIARNISVNPVLVWFFNNTNMSDLDKINAFSHYVVPFMEWVKNLNPSIYEMRFFTFNTGVFENQWIYHTTKVENESWFRAALDASQQTPYWEPLHKRRIFEYSRPKAISADNEYEISLFIPLMSMYNDENTYTMIEIYLNPKNLFDKLHDSTLYKDGQLLVLNGKGDIVFQTNNDLSKLSEKAAEWSKTVRTPSESRIINIDSVPYYINVESVSNLGYKLVGVYPLPAVMRKAKEAQVVYVICFSLAFIILFVISYIFTKRLMKKIKQLVKVIREVQYGNLDINVPIRGKDEIAELGQDFNLMIDRIKQLIDQVYKAEILQKEALLMSLYNQINPHFIYNSLETVKMMAEVKREKGISDALTSLGDLVRYNLSKGSNLVLLQVELDQIRSYCDLQNLMLNRRLSYDIVVNDPVTQLKVLKLILQPVVENAILHGFENYDGKCLITVVVEKCDDNIRVSIKDNGKGMTAERLEAVRGWIYGDSDTPGIPLKGSGIGLRNVHRRIQLNFGNIYGIAIESIKEQGAEVIITLPVIKEQAIGNV